MARILNNIAVLHEEEERYEEVEALVKRSVAIAEKRLGLKHPFVMVGLGNLGEVARKKGAPSLSTRKLLSFKKTRCRQATTISEEPCRTLQSSCAWPVARQRPRGWRSEQWLRGRRFRRAEPGQRSPAAGRPEVCAARPSTRTAAATSRCWTSSSRMGQECRRPILEAPGLEPLECLGHGLIADLSQVGAGVRGAHERLESIQLVDAAPVKAPVTEHLEQLRIPPRRARETISEACPTTTGCRGKRSGLHRARGIDRP